MARGEEVERLLVDRPRAAEGAEEGGAQRHAGEMVHQRLVAELDPPGPLAALLLHLEAEARGGPHHDALVQRVELRRHAGEDLRRQLGPVRVAVELVEGGVLHPVVGRLSLQQNLAKDRGSDLRRPLDRRLFDRLGDVAQLPLQPAQRLAEETDRLVEVRHGAAEAGLRPEVDDLRGDRAADAVQTADALLHHAGVPGQVEQHQPAAELKIPPLAARLGGEQQRRPLGQAELGHLDVPPLGGEVLVEDAGPPPLALDDAFEQLQRLAVGHEDERLLLRADPAQGLLGQPAHPRVLVPGRGGQGGRLSLLAAQAREQGRRRGEAAEHPVQLAPPRHGVRRRLGPQVAHQTVDGLPVRRRQRDRLRHARRQAADVQPPGGAGAGRQRLAPGQPLVEGLRLGELLRAQELEQAEETVGVVLQGGGGEQQDVPAESGDGRHGPVGLGAGMTLGPPQVVSLVDHQQVDPRRHRLLGEPAMARQGLETDDRLAVDVEGIEALAVVLRHVAQALVVEEDEDLVVLAPQLAQPLQDERLGRHHQGAPGAAGVEEAVEDQAGLDRLAQPHLVGQQPAHGIAVAGPLGDVELVGEELDAAAEERAQAAGLADALQAQTVQPVGEVLEAVHVAAGQALHGGDLRRQRPQRVEGDLAAVRQAAEPRFAGLDDHDLARPLQPRLAARLDGERYERVRARGEAQGLIRVRELDAQAPPLDRHDAPRPELGMESMTDAIARLPHGKGIVPGKEIRNSSLTIRRPSYIISPWPTFPVQPTSSSPSSGCCGAAARAPSRRSMTSSRAALPPATPRRSSSSRS